MPSLPVLLGLDPLVVEACPEFWDSPQAAALVERYREPHRHYHNLTHLTEILRHVAAHAAHFTSLRVAVYAALYHDVIYDPQRKDNEAQSAHLAARDLVSWLSSSDLAGVISLIDATAHHGAKLAEGAPGVGLFLDCDAAIMGADAERYQQYADAVRREYEHVPSLMYRWGRRRFLAKMLARPSVFHTAWFTSAYGERAHANLRAERASLRGSLPWS